MQRNFICEFIALMNELHKAHCPISLAVSVLIAYVFFVLMVLYVYLFWLHF